MIFRSLCCLVGIDSELSSLMRGSKSATCVQRRFCKSSQPFLTSSLRDSPAHPHFPGRRLFQTIPWPLLHHEAPLHPRNTLLQDCSARLHCPDPPPSGTVLQPWQGLFLRLHHLHTSVRD